MSNPNKPSRWNTKKEKHRHYQALLHWYSNFPYEPIEEPHAGEIQQLLDEHPSAAEKIGPGVKYHFVAPSRLNSKQFGFRLRRIDGTEVEWSYLRALKGKHRSTREQFRHTLRHEIRDQTRREKRRWKRSRERDLGTEAEVDHAGMSFNEFAERMEAEAIRRFGRLEAVKIEDKGGGETRFADREFAEFCQVFHRDNASAGLEVVKVGEHRRRTAQRRRNDA